MKKVILFSSILACIVTAAGWLVFAFNDQWWHVHGFIYALSMIEPLANATLDH